MDEEPKNSGRFGPGNPGKPKGALSHTTRTAKAAIAIAAERIGGADRLVDWIKEDPQNERAFWTSIYPKLLPLQLTGEDGGAIQTISRIELVALSARPDSTDSTPA